MARIRALLHTAKTDQIIVQNFENAVGVKSKEPSHNTLNINVFFNLPMGMPEPSSTFGTTSAISEGQMLDREVSNP